MQTLENWRKASMAGKLTKSGGKPATPVQNELSRLRAEEFRLPIDLETSKKAAANFAKELP